MDLYVTRSPESENHILAFDLCICEHMCVCVRLCVCYQHNSKTPYRKTRNFTLYLVFPLGIFRRAQRPARFSAV